jgi:hypothetical protein
MNTNCIYIYLYIYQLHTKKHNFTKVLSLDVAWITHFHVSILILFAQKQ